MSEFDTGIVRDEPDEYTPGPLNVGQADPTKDMGDWFREHLSYGTGPVWVVWAPDHPLTVVGDDPNRPEHAVVVAITGNGPASEANADLIASAPALLEACKASEIYLRESGFVSRSDPACDCKTCQLFRTLHAAIALAEASQEPRREGK